MMIEITADEFKKRVRASKAFNKIWPSRRDRNHAIILEIYGQYKPSDFETLSGMSAWVTRKYNLIAEVDKETPV
jgi:hypothetical protein